MDVNTLKHFEEIIRNDYSNIAGIVVQKNARPVYEKYFNGYTADDAIHIYSVTKSVFSILMGIAIDKGYIESVDKNVLDFFPHYKARTDEKIIHTITLRDMLTMTAPYKYAVEPYEAFFASENWMLAALDVLGGKEKSGEFMYSAIVGVHILSGILVQATGKSVFDFAAENLFSPLGIHVAQNMQLHSEAEQMAFYTAKSISAWVADPQGINPAGWGLALTPMDMVKLGQMYLYGGLWGSRQIVSAQWIEESTRQHSSWGDLMYGYLWWVINEKEGSYAAMGDGGNALYVNTQKNMVVAITSSFMPDAKDRIAFIEEYVVPLFEDAEE